MDKHKGSNKTYTPKKHSKFAPRQSEKSISKKQSYNTSKMPTQTVPAPKENKNSLIRLNRYLANSGLGSRREADVFIQKGLIKVNGKVVTEMGHQVHPSDNIQHKDKVLTPEQLIYILLNKPKGVITTTSDPDKRKTVVELIGEKYKERTYPVGRLDKNTTGLLLLTNDGMLANKLMHPSYKVKKIYKATLGSPLKQPDLERLKQGIRLDEGIAILDEIVLISNDRKTVGIELHIGWNRIVHRVFEKLNYSVVKLDRVVYAGLDKKNLPRGKWRPLESSEIIQLKHFC